MIKSGIIVILLENIVEWHMIIVKIYVIPKYIPIVFHNLRSHDSHFIVQNLGKYKEKIDIIPNNTEKYTPISAGNSRNKHVYLRFIDSLQFMSDSLESLVKNMNNFII